jgi:hypothetical protein
MTIFYKLLTLCELIYLFLIWNQDITEVGGEEGAENETGEMR